MAEGWVYFIRCPSNGLIKIGWTTNDPETRFINIRSMSPVPLETVALLEAMQVMERRLHLRFQDAWSHGEWFWPRQELMEFIADRATPWEARPSKSKERLVVNGLPVALESIAAHLEMPDAARLRKWAAKEKMTAAGVTRTVLEWHEASGVSLADLRECRDILLREGRMVQAIHDALVASVPASE